MSTYTRPSMMAQLGLAEDPNALVHVTTSGGHKLTRTVTAGGHAVNSSQPGFPVYHRRIANPIPLLAISIGASLLIFGLALAGIRSITNFTIWYTVGLPLGFVGSFTACMFAFAEGNTFLATLAGTLGSISGGVSILSLPWAGIQAAYIGAANGNVPVGAVNYFSGVSLVTFVSIVPLFCLLVASLRTAVPVSSSILLIIIGFILEGVHFLRYPDHQALQTAGGVVCVVVGVTLYYLALAVMLAEEGIKILPIIPLPRID